MKNSFLNIKTVVICGALSLSSAVIAGNEDRVGSNGAGHMLVNPWARSSAMGDAGIASSSGLEAQFLNVAGLASTNKTQIKFNHTNWMGTISSVPLNSAGIAQRVGENSVIAISFQSFNYGDLMRTTVANPEGNIGTYSPRANIVNISYARKFSNTISAGVNLKVISETMENVKANGLAFDAGIRYVTTDEKLKFGIALRNVGGKMKPKGDGFHAEASIVGSPYEMSLEQRLATYEMPALLAIGGSWDFVFNETNKLVLNLGYTANSFAYDQYRIGLDYSFASNNVAFNIMGGYVYERKITSIENRANALIGPACGFSVDALVGKDRSIKDKTAIGVEYTARFAGIFGIVHTFGATISIK